MSQIKGINMFKSVRLNAREQFAASQKKDNKARAEKEQLQQEEAQHVAKLRAMRLAKEPERLVFY